MVLVAVALVLFAMLWIWPLIVGFLVGQIDHSATQGWRWRLSRSCVWLTDHMGLLILCGIAVFVVLVWVIVVEVGGGNHWPDRAPQLTALGLAGAILFTYGNLFRPSVWVASLRVRPDGAKVWPYRHELRVIPGVDNDIFLGIHNAGITAWNRYRITVEFPDGFAASEPAPDRELEWAPGDINVFGSRAQLERNGPIAVAEPHVLRLVVTSPRAIPTSSHVLVRVACAGHIGEAVCNLPIRASGPIRLTP